jgi:ribose 1,5-bisphosphokinase
MSAGRLFAVVGPSGAGKDALIARAAAARPDLHVVQRVITRPETPDGEPFKGVARPAFEARRASGGFALWWQAHGLLYGIPAELDGVLAAGRDALFNGSRAMLGEARARYPALRVIHVTAAPETRARRLAARGREGEAGIAARLQRGEAERVPGPIFATIENDGELEAAAADFLAALAPESPAQAGRQETR